MTTVMLYYQKQRPQTRMIICVCQRTVLSLNTRIYKHTHECVRTISEFQIILSMNCDLEGNLTLWERKLKIDGK
jgi:hypothetical protein